MPDARLALELDRALGGEVATGEVGELAALLRAAAAPARFAVGELEVEHALQRTRPVRRARRRLVPAFGLACAVAAAAAAAFLLHTPGSDVQARASRALDATFFVLEETRPARPGLFPATDVSGYVDGRRGRAHVRVSSPATGPVAELVLDPDGSVTRWQAAPDRITVAPSCAALAGGCAEALDPLSLYLRALQGRGVSVRRASRSFVLELPGGRVRRRVVVDAATYLPRRIEVRQDGALVAVTRFAALERQAVALSADTWAMSPHSGARVQQVVGAGRPVRVIASRPGRLSSVRRWLGSSYEGEPARISQVDLTGGRATRIAYGSLVVWNYGNVVPPTVVQGRGQQAKVFAIPGGVVHAYYGLDAQQIAEVSFGDTTVGIVSGTGDNVDVVRAAQQLTRPGSP